MYKVVKLAEASRTISGIFLLFPPSLTSMTLSCLLL